MLIVTSSTGRMDNLQPTETKPGNSCTHGAHQVAQTFTIRYFSVSLRANFETASTSIFSSVTGVFSHFALNSFTIELFSIHFTEQPCGLVTSDGTAVPASKARIALGPSVVLTVAGSGKR